VALPQRRIIARGGPAARASGIPRTDNYRWLGEPGYKIAFDQATENATQYFEDEVC
jgi:hypothetical protein